MDGSHEVRTEPRVVSLDVYRGLVVATMIFVNFVHGLPHMPAWLLHGEARANTFTFPDIVFPGFLMLVGVAIPLSLRRYLNGTEPLRRVLGHALGRTGGLLLLGVVYDFNSSLVPANTGMRREVWLLGFYLGAILFWLRYPETSDARRRRLYGGLRVLGALTLVVMLALFRGPAKPGGGYEWLHHEWWGILGLIGWCYLNTTLLYLLVRGRDQALFGVVAAMVALYMGSRHGLLDFLGPTINGFVAIGEVFGSTSAAVAIGTLIGNRFVRPEPARDRLRFMIALGVGCYSCAVLLRPVHGYSKIQGTESFFLATCGIHAILLALAYYVVDVRASRRGTLAVALGLVGSNALLAYILPDLWATALSVVRLDGVWFRTAWGLASRGFPFGLLNLFLVTTAMVAAAAFLTKRGLRLRL